METNQKLKGKKKQHKVSVYQNCPIIDSFIEWQEDWVHFSLVNNTLLLA